MDRWTRSQKRRALREKVIAIMGGCCRICGYQGSPVAFDAHHLDPKSKEFNISSRGDFQAIEKELKGCILLCARCHREVHDGWHPQYLIQEDAERGDDPYAAEG